MRSHRSAVFSILLAALLMPIMALPTVGAVDEGVNKLGTGPEIIEGLQIRYLRFDFGSSPQFIHTFDDRAQFLIPQKLTLQIVRGPIEMGPRLQETGMVKQQSGRSSPPAPVLESATSRIFLEHVKAYVGLRTNLEGTLPKLKLTNDAVEIATHQRLLSAKIVEARHNARQGDVFTPEVASEFRELIRKTFQEPNAPIIRRTINEGDPPKPIVVKVNAVYPDESPVVTTPPTLLMRLPELPKELAYRVLGKSFVLLDNKTNLIVDFIPDAIP